MRIDLKSRTGRALVAGGAIFLSSCALTTRPQPMKQFFLPPSRTLAAPAEPVLDPPSPPSAYYGNEVPMVTIAFTPLPRPTDAEFLIKKADDNFAEGKKALEAGNAKDARIDFDRAVEALLSAPENLPDRARVERRLEELIEAIYRYDADQAAVGESDKVVYDKRPMDGMVELTFSPTSDPGTRSKVMDMIRSTTSQLPLQQHDTVIGAVSFFSSERGKRIIAAGLKRQGRYKTLIERILAEEGVPQELMFLAQADAAAADHVQDHVVRLKAEGLNHLAPALAGLLAVGPDLHFAVAEMGGGALRFERRVGDEGIRVRRFHYLGGVLESRVHVAIGAQGALRRLLAQFFGVLSEGGAASRGRGVIMLTKALAKAFAPTITVNSVAPGVIPYRVNGRAGRPHDCRDSGQTCRHRRRDRGRGGVFSIYFELRYRPDSGGRRWF